MPELGPSNRGESVHVQSGGAGGYDRGIDLSYYCDTDGGSSGSPVPSRASDRVIGLHHFGGCPNSGVRIDQIYEQVGKPL
jgi:lysyl endopeptidase